MKISGIRMYQVDLPLHEGSYKWSGGNAVEVFDATVVAIADASEGVAMVESGSVDAYAGDKIKLVGLAIQAKDPARLALLAEELSFEPYAFALPRDDHDFRLAVNRVIAGLYRGGGIKPIYERWLGPMGAPSILLTVSYYLQAIPE